MGAATLDARFLPDLFFVVDKNVLHGTGELVLFLEVALQLLPELLLLALPPTFFGIRVEELLLPLQLFLDQCVLLNVVDSVYFGSTVLAGEGP